MCTPQWIKVLWVRAASPHHLHHNKCLLLSKTFRRNAGQASDINVPIVERATPHFPACRNTGNSTALLEKGPKNPSAVNTVKKCMFLLVLWRCISEPILCHASVPSVARLSRGLGCSKATFVPTRGKNLFLARTVTEPSLIGLTSELTFRPTQMSRNTPVHPAARPFQGCLCWPNTQRVDVR